MATITRGYTFGATEQVTNAKLHTLVDSATVTGIVNADIASGAAIVNSKLVDIDGAKLTGLANISASAGVIPAANMPTVTGANNNITSLSGLTTPLSVAQGGTGQSSSPLLTGKGGTGSVADANAASGVVVLNASSQLPAVSGELLTNIPVASASSYATNGYFVIGGFYLQWGETGAGSGPVAVTFPIAFPNVCYQVVCCPGTNSGIDNVGAYSISASGCTIDLGGGAEAPVRWIAVGR
mgnify:CR=1 FL=1